MVDKDGMGAAWRRSMWGILDDSCHSITLGEKYRYTSLYCTFPIVHFFCKLKFCSNHTSTKSISTLFNSICSLHISVSHFNNFHSISSIFIITIFICYVICDQWSLMVTLWLFWHFLAIKYFLIKVYTLFFFGHNATADLIDYSIMEA